MTTATPSHVRRVVILGSTGSIGTQTLQVIRDHPGLFLVEGLAAGGTRMDLLARQALEFSVPTVALATGDPSDLREAIHAIDPKAELPQILCGPRAVNDLAASVPDGVVLNGITGAVGLEPTLSAVKSGARLALANKESLVVGGHLVKSACVRPGQIVPVDSEHSAIAQALSSGVHERGLCSPIVTGKTEVRDLILTASGGPFRGKTRAELANVTASQALAHPTWTMGPVVTINSSTLVNKGLELIEAHLLFDVAPEHILTTLHPQSIVHSMVTWNDGATTLQASPPDMRLPIALGLTWPARLNKVEEPLSWTHHQEWTFEPIDEKTFPAVALARYAVAASPTHPAVLNAANEVLVDAFISGRIAWLGIVDTLWDIVHAHAGITDPNLDDILGVQDEARAQAASAVKRLAQ